jgi:predicted DCC family thiol-disulfide oxidoreductase YuxK
LGRAIGQVVPTPPSWSVLTGDYRGLDAFLALLPGLKGGRVLSFLLSLPLVKPFSYLPYWFVAWYRYSIFGNVPLTVASKHPDTQNRETPPK